MSKPTCALPECAEPPMPKRGTGPAPIYCSKSHQYRMSYLRTAKASRRKRSESRRAAAERICPRCSEAFVPERTLKQVYCSKSCSRNAFRDSKTATCTETGCDRPRRARGLCSMHWRRVARSEGREKAPVWDERRAARHGARKALERGATAAEAFMKREIYERDDWTCGICDAPVNKGLSYPDPLSASLDDVVPLSKGGAHTRRNVQCAHLVCNLQKGAAIVT